jgi:hypothetical protein
VKKAGRFTVNLFLLVGPGAGPAEEETPPSRLLRHRVDDVVRGPETLRTIPCLDDRPTSALGRQAKRSGGVHVTSSTKKTTITFANAAPVTWPLQAMDKAWASDDDDLPVAEPSDGAWPDPAKHGLLRMIYAVGHIGSELVLEFAKPSVDEGFQDWWRAAARGQGLVEGEAHLEDPSESATYVVASGSEDEDPARARPCVIKPL